LIEKRYRVAVFSVESYIIELLTWFS